MAGADRALLFAAARLGLPRRAGDPVLRAENLLHQQIEMGEFMIVDRDRDEAVVAQEIPEQAQARVHHAQPFVVAALVACVGADRLAEPGPDLG